ncbi:MAG TPA: hypothetical protein VHZ31_05335 [Solirubrobacteraceae bacterium]|jgi:hypothetical protein|nr:hypothetical protein [Solirubrobacteraceae bacterium]
MSDQHGPTVSAHRSHLLRVLLEADGPMVRKEVVDAAVALGPWTHEQRALAPTSRNPKKYRSLLHQRAWYSLWPMKDEGLVEAVERGMYVITEDGRAEAERLTAEAGPRRVGRLFPANRRAPERRTGQRTIVFEYDPDERDRQTVAHEELVHQIKDAVTAAGLEPLVPDTGDPPFDVAFYARDGETLVVIEVKSLGDSQPVHQLRLGLGQVLQYSFLLSAERPVQAALAVPVDPPGEWPAVCSAAGVMLVVADELDDEIERLADID